MINMFKKSKKVTKGEKQAKQIEVKTKNETAKKEDIIMEKKPYFESKNNYSLFAKTNAIIGIIAFTYLIYSLYASNSFVNSRLDQMYSIAKENVYSTILMTPNGIPLNVKKIPISPDSDSFKDGIKRFLKDLMVDAIEITKGKQEVVSKAMSIYDNTKRLQDFYIKYIQRKDIDTQRPGFKSFTEFLNFLFILYSNDNLPENIRILSSEVKNYIVTDNSYLIEVEYKVYFESYIIERDKNEKRVGTIKIKANGDFNLDESTINNPYGNKIGRFSIEYVHKRPLDNNVYFGTETAWDILDFNKRGKK